MADIEVELHVHDFAIAEDFYGALGFRRTRHDSSEGHGSYLVLRLGDAALRFWPGTPTMVNSFFAHFPAGTRPGFGVELVIKVPDLDATYRAAERLGAVVAPMTLRPWGLRDFRAADPFGYYLRFTEPHEADRPPEGTTPQAPS